MQSPRGRPRTAIVLHGTVIAATAVLLALDVLPPLLVDDAKRYVQLAEGPTFWREQPVEFPPLSALMVWFVGQWGAASTAVLMALNVALDVGTAAVLSRHWGAHQRDRYLLLSALLLPLTLFRVDHLSVLWVVLALSLLHRGHRGLAGSALGLGTLVKLWPAVLVAAGGRRDRSLVLAGLGAGALGIGAWIAAFGPDGVRQVLTYRGSTGWHVESLVGSVSRLVGDPAVRYEAGAWRTGHVDGSWLVLLVVLGSLIWVASRRLPDLTSRALALVTGLLLVAPLFSLQYVLWLVPLVAVLPAGEMPRRAAMLVGVAAALSMLLALFYNELLLGTGIAMVTLATRNLVLVGLLGLTLAEGRARPWSRGAGYPLPGA